ncbi:MAG: hypothetical protein HFH35_12755 [Eubacterium sp.]|nr:hypothetical protein [Eubacterium sp.]
MEKSMATGKRKTLAAVGLVLLVVLTAVVCYFIFHKDNEGNLLYDDNASAGILPGIDLDARRAELQEMLDESMIAFSINTSPVFLNGTSAGNLMIENPGNNAKLIKVRILADGSDEEIYASNFIKPGSYIENAKLSKVLKKGTYPATAYFSAYQEDTGAYIGQTGAQITITVQN